MRRFFLGAVRALVAGVLVYLGIAACSASSASDNAGTARTGPSASGPTGASDASGGGALDAIVGAVTNPIPTASADPVVPTIETALESCDKTYAVGANTVYYAEHQYPGVTLPELATTVAVTFTLSTTPNAGYPPGYTEAITVPAYRDGSVAIACGYSPTATKYRFTRRH